MTYHVSIPPLPESCRLGKWWKSLPSSSYITTATQFEPMYQTWMPENHFPLHSVYPDGSNPQFVNRYNDREMMIVTNGSVSQPATGGCSFIFTGTEWTAPRYTWPYYAWDTQWRQTPGTVRFPLEQTGADGEQYVATSNRAKLRAVIAALTFREWARQGWKRVVIVTDLEYIVHGATWWLPLWVRHGWNTWRWRIWRGQEIWEPSPIANRDLWEELHAILKRLTDLGTEVSFWFVPLRDIDGNVSRLLEYTKTIAHEVAVTARPRS